MEGKVEARRCCTARFINKLYILSLISLAISDFIMRSIIKKGKLCSFSVTYDVVFRFCDVFAEKEFRKKIGNAIL